MAFPRFTTPFKRPDEQYDFEPTPLRARRLPNVNTAFADYQDEDAVKGRADYRSEIDKLYGTGEAMNKFYEHVQNVPQEADYQPGKYNRIVAALAGVGAGWTQGAGAGVRAATNITRRPYEQAVEEYQLKGQGLKAAADIEQERDAKRVAYLNQLRQFDKDAYERTIKEMDAESRRVTALARQKQAENQAQLVTLTEARDKATDERERKRIQKEIDKVQNDLELGKAANAINSRKVEAFRERTVEYGKKGSGKTTERVISPQAQNSAEVSAAGALLNTPKYSWLKNQGIVTVGKDFIDVGSKKKTVGGWFKNEKEYDVTPEDQKRIDEFLADVEKEKRKRLNQTISLGGKKGNEDIIDLDEDDDEEP